MSIWDDKKGWQNNYTNIYWAVTLCYRMLKCMFHLRHQEVRNALLGIPKEVSVYTEFPSIYLETNYKTLETLHSLEGCKGKEGWKLKTGFCEGEF